MILRATLELVAGSVDSKKPNARYKSGLRSDNIFGTTFFVVVA
jgi:hypothetical protein